MTCAGSSRDMRTCARAESPSGPLCSLCDLPVVLIEGRIAARMTQRDLAARLGVPEQQVRRWEINGYLGVGSNVCTR